MITGVCGKPGSGKTLFMLWVMGQMVKSGRQVFTNIALTDDCPFADRVYRLDDEALDWPVFNVVEEPRKGYVSTGRKGEYYRAFWHFVPKGSGVFVSEADNYWDSLEFGSMPKVCRIYWKQHRKWGHTVYLDYQNIDNLYNRVRRMMETFVLCEHNYRSHWLFRHFPVTWSSFWHASFSHEALRERDMMEAGKFRYSEARQMFSWYRTDQLYGAWGQELVGEQERASA